MDRYLDLCEAAFGRLLVVLAALTAISIGLIAIGIPLNLVLVKMQWGSIWWLYEAVEYTIYVGVFITAPWVLRQGAHVRVDVLVAVLPPGLALRLEQVLDVAGAAISAVLCWYGTRAAISEYVDGTLPDKDLRIANWYMLTVFAVGFALLGIEFLFRIRRSGQPVDAAKARF
jgi:TRAP-type C4-dicarboxylate transport system permease small subunit